MSTKLVPVDAEGVEGIAEDPKVGAGLQHELLEQALILEVAASCGNLLKHHFKDFNGAPILRVAKNEVERNKAVDNFIALWRQKLGHGTDTPDPSSELVPPEGASDPEASILSSKFFRDTIASVDLQLPVWSQQGFRNHHQAFFAVESLGKPPVRMKNPMQLKREAMQEDVSGMKQDGRSMTNQQQPIGEVAKKSTISSKFIYEVPLNLTEAPTSNLVLKEVQIEKQITNSTATNRVVEREWNHGRMDNKTGDNDNDEDSDDNLHLQYLGYPFLGLAVYRLYFSGDMKKETRRKARVIQILTADASKRTPLNVVPAMVTVRLRYEETEEGGAHGECGIEEEVKWSSRYICHIDIEFDAYLDSTSSSPSPSPSPSSSLVNPAALPATATKDPYYAPATEALSSLYDVAFSTEEEEEEEERGRSGSALEEEQELGDTSRKSETVARLLSGRGQPGGTTPLPMLNSHVEKDGEGRDEQDGIDVVFFRGYKLNYASMMARRWVRCHGKVPKSVLFLLKGRQDHQEEEDNEEEDAPQDIKDALAALSAHIEPSLLDGQLLANRLREAELYLANRKVPKVILPQERGRRNSPAEIVERVMNTSTSTSTSTTTTTSSSSSSSRRRNSSQCKESSINASVELTSHGVATYLHDEGASDGDPEKKDLVVGDTPVLNLRVGIPMRFPLRRSVHIQGTTAVTSSTADDDGSSRSRGTSRKRRSSQLYWDTTDVLLRTDIHFHKEQEREGA